MFLRRWHLVLWDEITFSSNSRRGPPVCHPLLVLGLQLASFLFTPSAKVFCQKLICFSFYFALLCRG